MKTFLDFEKEVKSNKLRNVYYFLVNDNYFITKASGLLREKLYGSRENKDNFFLKYADETSLEELIDLNNNFPSLFSTQKIIVLKKCEKYSRKLDELFEFVKNPDPDTFILMCFDRDFVKEKKIGKEIEFYDFSQLPDMKEWIRSEFSAYGKKISDDAIEYLEANMPLSFDYLHMEIEKLSSYNSGLTDEINKDFLIKFTGYDIEFTPNDLMKSILRNDTGKAVQILDNLLNKTGINEIYLVSIISNYYFDLLSFNLNKLNTDNYSVFNKYKIWGERVNFTKEYRNILNLKELEKAISLILEVDKKLKTSMLDSKVLLTSLTEELCNL